MSNIEVGKTYNGTVKSVRNFGVFVECIAGEEGLVHISELDNCRIENIDAVCSVGDSISVKCIGVDDQGRVRLSHRAVICEEQGLPYEIREVKPKRSFSGGGFGNRSSGGRSFGTRKYDNRGGSGNGGRSFGKGGFGHSRRPSSGGPGFSHDY
ncbi:MAG: S1 RNA-binding domain-containing protein [Puniceicoccales bacterium]|jgi:polyribonucleotide nucleotidyltransferase|nr:S1 RNA-binding domain-containing protein [Puniceicoccales bacterium]